MTRIFILWLLWKLFGLPSVMLEDFDGEINPRLVRGFRNYKYVIRMFFGPTARVFPNGVLTGCCYCTKWHPLFPEDYSL